LNAAWTSTCARGTWGWYGDDFVGKGCSNFGDCFAVYVHAVLALLHRPAAGSMDCLCAWKGRGCFTGGPPMVRWFAGIPLVCTPVAAHLTHCCGTLPSTCSILFVCVQLLPCVVQPPMMSHSLWLWFRCRDLDPGSAESREPFYGNPEAGFV
jgi:hypothetical protein